MAVFWCECGERLSNSQNPNIDYRIYSDNEWINIVEDESITEPILIPHPDYTAWLCPKCKRVHIWKSGEMKRIALYERVVIKEKKLEKD